MGWNSASQLPMLFCTMACAELDKLVYLSMMLCLHRMLELLTAKGTNAVSLDATLPLSWFAFPRRMRQKLPRNYLVTYKPHNTCSSCLCKKGGICFTSTVFLFPFTVDSLSPPLKVTECWSLTAQNHF